MDVYTVHIYTADTHRSRQSHPHAKYGSPSKKDANVLRLDTTSEGVPGSLQMVPCHREHSNHNESGRTYSRVHVAGEYTSVHNCVNRINNGKIMRSIRENCTVESNKCHLGTPSFAYFKFYRCLDNMAFM